MRLISEMRLILCKQIWEQGRPLLLLRPSIWLDGQRLIFVGWYVFFGATIFKHLHINSEHASWRSSGIETPRKAFRSIIRNWLVKLTFFLSLFVDQFETRKSRWKPPWRIVGWSFNSVCWLFVEIAEIWCRQQNILKAFSFAVDMKLTKNSNQNGNNNNNNNNN